jgi:hypothetical protein
MPTQSAGRVLLAGRLPQGRPEPGDLVKGVVPLSCKAGDPGLGLGQLGVPALDPGGQVPDPGGELGGAGLGDLVAEASLDFRLEPVALVADASELGSRQLEVGG